MSELKSEFLRTLDERGFIHQCTDFEGLDALLCKPPVTVYIGFDATADSLHVGSLVQIMMLRWAQQTGHRVLALMGGGTTKVGDPSGKDESRQLLDDDSIAANITSIQGIFQTLLGFDGADWPVGIPIGAPPAQMVNNDDWLSGLDYIGFLRDYGRHFTINRMLTFDSVKVRLQRQQPLTFLEFNYMILQAFDFMQLSRRYACRLQLGGSDQWGNIVNGIELARRVDDASLYGLTTPLITTASGAKMGKTAQGAIWLNEARLGAYDFYQFWRNTDDADVARFLGLFTELPMSEVRRLGALQGQEINEAKRVLAFETTRLCRGESAARAAEQTAASTFGAAGRDEGLPTIDIARERLAEGLPAFVLFTEAGLTRSNGEARRLIKGDGGRLNDHTIEDDTRTVTLADLDAEDTLKLSAGKKRHVLVRAV
ncbi:MAG: tyrosine--tRNA ligase [Gammaproteobacteria bacterium]|nr:tyrosine--tRNA ligase [Gammaproteobacteria bacterium]